mgnify:CR=1 FL=1
MNKGLGYKRDHKETVFFGQKVQNFLCDFIEKIIGEKKRRL